MATVFVTGGCGFIGYHIVKALTLEKNYKTIHVMSRNPTKNLIDGVQYHQGDVADRNRIEELLSTIKPLIVFHVASPASAGNNGDLNSFLKPNVHGTQLLLESAANAGVKAFVFSSSTSVYREKNQRKVPEDSPLHQIGTTSHYYSISKALADTLVRETNGLKGMKTVCIRICPAYGERSDQMVRGIWNARANWRYQIGNNDNLWDHASVENITRLHLAAAQALLEGKEGIAAEAFNVTDDNPVPFWTFCQHVWKLGGVDVRQEEIKTIPAALMITMASFVEWLYWIFTLGHKRPVNFRRHEFEFMACTRTVCIEKAKARLGYQPVKNRDESIRADIAYCERAASSNS